MKVISHPASATGGGLSALLLSGFERKTVFIMADGFAGPQTSAATQPFVQRPSQEETAAHEPSNQGDFYSMKETQSQQQPSQQASATPPKNASTAQNRLTPTRRRWRRRGPRRFLRADSSVRDRLFRLDERRLILDERRLILEEQRNVILAGIKEALETLCRHIQQHIRPNI